MPIEQISVLLQEGAQAAHVILRLAHRLSLDSLRLCGDWWLLHSRRLGEN
jgi:hypothetical protein